jgi:hypothetical protein
MEAELTSLDNAGAEAEWLRDLLMDLPVVEKLIPAISMNCDNQTVITKVNSSRNNMKSTRHVKRRLKSIKKLKTFRVITVDYVHTSNNLRNMIESTSREMGMRPT